MKKLINKPENYVNEMLEGIYIAHGRDVKCVGDDLRCFVTTHKHPGKVSIATGGGSGHLPLFLGYVGEGMLDGCAVGDVFQSPSAEQMLAVTKEIDNGAGVLYIYGNYNGDIFNFDMAADMADMEDIRVESVVMNDDIAGTGDVEKRRGVAGIFFGYKCAGAAAAAGKDIDEVKRIAELCKSNTRTMGVALSACIVPRAGKAGFSINEDEIELGMGIHGETGIRKEKLKPVDDIVDDILSELIADLPYEADDEVAVLINGLGATPIDELYIIMRRLSKVLSGRQINIFKAYVGEFATSMEMAGASISLCKLNGELKSYISAAADTPFFKQLAF